jgi:hypothetical protein
MYLILVIISIILIFIAYQFGKHNGDMDMIQGFWESNQEFNKEAGLDSFTFYIGNKKYDKYPAYLLMIESGESQTLLINEPTSFTLKESIMNVSSDYREFYIKFNNLETQLLPNVLTMKFYPHTCKIVLLDHKKIYAVFFKNLVLSEMERIKNEKSKPHTSIKAASSKSNKLSDDKLDDYADVE